MRIFWATTLLDHLDRHAGSDRAATFTDGEAHPLLDRDRGDELDLHVDVVARHHHLGALGQLDLAGHVRGAHVELRAVPLEERRVAATLFLGEDVDPRVELGVRLDRAGLGQYLAALDLLALDAAQQAADVVARLAGIQQLVEHLHAGHHRLARVVDADHLDLFVDLDLATLDQLQDLGVIDRVDLVEGDDDPRHADLARQQDVLAGLGHRAVGGGHDQNRTVHLGGAGDHVLDVVRVPWAVDVRVVPLLGFVLDMGGRDRDAASLLLGSVVDRIEGAEFSESLL